MFVALVHRLQELPRGAPETVLGATTGRYEGEEAAVALLVPFCPAWLIAGAVRAAQLPPGPCSAGGAADFVSRCIPWPIAVINPKIIQSKLKERKSK